MSSSCPLRRCPQLLDVDSAAQIRLFRKLKLTKCARAKRRAGHFLCPRRGVLVLFPVVYKLTSVGRRESAASRPCKRPSATLELCTGCMALPLPLCRFVASGLYFQWATGPTGCLAMSQARAFDLCGTPLFRHPAAPNQIIADPPAGNCYSGAKPVRPKHRGVHAHHQSS